MNIFKPRATERGPQRYYWQATYNLHAVSLTEKWLSGDDRIVGLTVDHFPQVSLVFPSWYLPGVALGPEKFMVWCGTGLHVFNYKAEKFSELDVRDEIWSAYYLAGQWCVVCETSVILFDSEPWREIGRFQHIEVILSNWWADGLLMLEDFEGRRLRMKVGPSGFEVVEDR
ncbi:MAG: hypothetical protein ACJ75H_06470 [Thermoanaerobaculia bacterium]